MFFEVVAGHVLPVLPVGADGSARVADGSKTLTIEQAVDRLGMSREHLEAMWRAVWGEMMPDTETPLAGPAAHAGEQAAADGIKNASAAPDASCESPAAGTDPLMRARMAVLRRVRFAHLSDDQFDWFMESCRQRRLNPWSRQVFCSVQLDEATDRESPELIVGINGQRLMAHRTGVYAGADEIAFDLDAQGRPVSATARVYRLVAGERAPFTATVRWSDYYPGEGTFWDSRPYIALGTVAEAAALRKAFPEELGAVYVPEEMEKRHEGAKSRKRNGSGDDRPAVAVVDEMPEVCSPGTLERALIDEGLTDIAARSRVLRQLRREFHLGDEPEPYARAIAAVRRSPRKYGVGLMANV